MTPPTSTAGEATPGTDPGDERLDILRRRAREWAAQFRDAAPSLDRDPELAGSLTGLAGVRWLSTAGIPERFGGEPLTIGRHRYPCNTAVERAVVLEELARGDVGVLMAAPGSSMCGVLIDELGSEEQKRRFYGPLVREPTWTFFALTEPDHGSDAGSMDTAVLQAGDGSSRLTGAKRYIGNAARASHGVVFARAAPGPFGVGAYLLETTRPGFVATPLPMIGIRGAQVCDVRLDGLPVEPEDEIGGHLPRSRRGMRACTVVFNRLRPGVAAMALGVAGAALDVLGEHWPAPPTDVVERLLELRWRVRTTRELVLEAARRADAGADGSMAAVAKARACRLAEEVTLNVAELLGPGARLRDDRLDRLLRDARGVEFMEGTSNIQLLTAFQGLSSGRLGGPPPPVGAPKGRPGRPSA